MIIFTYQFYLVMICAPKPRRLIVIVIVVRRGIAAWMTVALRRCARPDGRVSGPVRRRAVAACLLALLDFISK